MSQTTALSAFLNEHWEPDDNHMLLRGLVSLTLAFANVLDLYDVELEALVRKTCDAVEANPTRDGIDDGVMMALSGLKVYGFADGVARKL